MEWPRGTGRFGRGRTGVLAFLAEEFLLNRTTAEAVLYDEDTKWLEYTFDWLDGSRLAQRVERTLGPAGDAQTRSPAVLRPFSYPDAAGGTLAALAAIIREGRVRLDGADDSGHANLLRLLSACGAPASEMESVRIRRWLETALKAASAAARSANPARQLAAALRALQTGSAARADVLRQTSEEIREAVRCGEDAVLLAAEITKQLRRSAGGGTEIVTTCAGLFLLVRGLQDVRLAAAVRQSGCTLQPVLASLAIALAGEDAWHGDSFDEGAALWAGIQPQDAREHIAALASMPLPEMASELTSNIEGQRLVDPVEQAKWEAGPELPAAVLQVATLALHAWARWLPGLSGSSMPYLLRNFVRRGGSLHVDRDAIEVRLDPAPLDSILRMSGYLADLAPVPWLENRAVRFQLSSQVS
jgi:hypothetical protein